MEGGLGVGCDDGKSVLIWYWWVFGRGLGGDGGVDGRWLFGGGGIGGER